MPVSNPRNLYFDSNTPIDRILGTFEGTATVTAGGTSSTPFSTSISERTLFQAQYSPDSGTTWKDFNIRSFSSSLEVHGRSNANTFTVKLDNTTGGSNRSIEYRVALIAKPDQGDVTPQPVGAEVIFDTRLNYQKIKLDTSRAISVANTNEITEEFEHGLGYIPKTRTFIEIASTYQGYAAGLYDAMFFVPRVMSAGATTPDAGVESMSGVYLDDDNLYVVLNNQSGSGDFSGTFYARVYYDD